MSTYRRISCKRDSSITPSLSLRFARSLCATRSGIDMNRIPFVRKPFAILTNGIAVDVSPRIEPSIRVLIVIIHNDLPTLM